MPWVLAQTARDVLAVHVPVDPGALGPRLPPGVRPDEHQGSAWVSLVAMRMVRVHPRWLPSVPGVSSFSQVAVRAFVRAAADAEEGVAFLGLEVSRRLVAGVGRVVLGLPFERSDVSVQPGMVRSDRWTTGWRTEGPATADPFLAERDVLFSTRHSRLCRSLVRHPPVASTRASVDGEVGGALARHGLAATGPAIVLATAELPSHVWLPKAVDLR